jgi:hypothetical protein
MFIIINNKNIFKQNNHILSMLNKRGQMSVETLIAIVIGVIILVAVVWGFTTNWQIFSSFTGGNNVDTVVSQCQAACTTASVYGFCNQNRTLKADGLPNDAEGKAQKQVSNTCKYFSTDSDFLKYGIAACSSITCP